MKTTITMLVAAALAATAGGCGHGRSLVDEARAGETTATVVEIPLNTDIVGRLDQALGTDTNFVGDAFALTTVDAVVVDGRVVLGPGAVIAGELCDVRARGRLSGARMTLSFRSLTTVDGRLYALTAEAVTLKAARVTGDGGRVINGDGPDDADTDGVLGPGSGQGSVVVLSWPGQDVRLDRGQMMRVRLTSPVRAAKGI